MAEKAFKVPSLALVGSNDQLAVNTATGDLWWGINALATQYYVDSAVSNVTVNTNALAATLAGDGLYDIGDGVLHIGFGTAIFNEFDHVAVNTNAVAEALAGTGLDITNGDDLSVRLGSGLYFGGVGSNEVSVNVNALYDTGGPLTLNNEKLDVNVNTISQLLVTSWGAQGLYRDAYDTIGVNVNAIAGSGLYSDDTTNYTRLAINTNVIATRAYVDAVAEGLHIHASVRAATTGPVDLSKDVEAGDTLDTNVTLIAGDRILVKNQQIASENGIYVVQASGQPTRATDFDTATEVDSGDFVFVSEGATQAGTGWVQVNKPAVIGTDPIAFTQFSGAGTYTAGNGLDLTGNVFSVNTGSGIWINSDAVAVNANALAGDGLTSATGDSLAINPGFGIVLRSDAVVVNTNALAGAGLAGGWDSLSVNTNAIAESLVGTGLYVTNGDDLAVNANALATSFINLDFAAKTLRVRSAGAGAGSLTKNYYATTETSNTYVTVGTLDFSNIGGSCVLDIDLLVQIPDQSGIKTRSSKLSGVFYTLDDTSEYTEYAICEKNGAASDFDARLLGRDIQVKASFSSSYGTLVAIAKASITGQDI